MVQPKERRHILSHDSVWRRSPPRAEPVEEEALVIRRREAQDEPILMHTSAEVPMSEYAGIPEHLAPFHGAVA